MHPCMSFSSRTVSVLWPVSVLVEAITVIHFLHQRQLLVRNQPPRHTGNSTCHFGIDTASGYSRMPVTLAIHRLRHVSSS